MIVYFVRAVADCVRDAMARLVRDHYIWRER